MNLLSKLNVGFKINPLYEADGYKVGHPNMLAPDTNREYWTWIPRNLKYMGHGIDKIMSFGQQITMRYIHSAFQENFFDVSEKKALKFIKDMSLYLGIEYNGEHFKKLHWLGYLPIEVQSLPEGIFTNSNIPHMTGINTRNGFAWLGLYLETMFSKLSWQAPIAATIGHKFKTTAVEWVKKTDSENLWLADFMCHDFHSRGGNPYTSIAVGLGHATSNTGSDTLNVIPAARYYYDEPDDEVCINSVNASEHSVTCTGIFYFQRLLKEGELNDRIAQYYSFDAPCEGSFEEPDYLAIAEWLNLESWLKKFPKGILSVVSDTFDLWKLITFILPRLKDEILTREGKLVIRPDSGDPVDILCGKFDSLGNPWKWEDVMFHCNDDENKANWSKNENKGVIELLWDIFGGDESKEGYKRLDSHIGAIYGDSITLDRQKSIYERLAIKGFAATNVVLGIGSYTYVYITRDTAGFAAKGAWFERLENFYASPESLEPGEVTLQYNIYKDPATDNGTKKSLKGFQLVVEEDGEIVTKSEVTEEEAFSDKNLLHTIYKDGEFFNQTTLKEIRKRLA